MFIVVLIYWLGGHVFETNGILIFPEPLYSHSSVDFYLFTPSIAPYRELSSPSRHANREITMCGMWNIHKYIEKPTPDARWRTIVTQIGGGENK